jgi:hypothetical protein
MKRIAVLALAVAALVGLGSCALFKSGDAAILTFVFDGLVGSATIDADAGTITATVEPMDLSAATPEVTVSEKAELTQHPALVDGEAVTYVVTAENGSTAEWTVTVTVQYGMSFSLDGTKVVLTAGIVNSADATLNEQYGNGVPLAALNGGDTLGAVALAEQLDMADPPAAGAGTEASLMFAWAAGDPGPGTFDGTTAAFNYMTTDYLAAAGAFTATPTTLVAEITALGAVGGDVVGTFSGTVVDTNDATPALTDGFLKARRVADDLTL